MNEHKIKAKLSLHKLTLEQFLEWIEGEPKPENGYYPKDVDRFIYWKTTPTISRPYKHGKNY